MPQIQLLDGKKITFTKSINGLELAKKISKSLEKTALIMEVDGDLSHEIRKNSKVLIIEDVITTGKSSLECVSLIKKYNAKLIGFACLINRSSKNSLKIKNRQIVSQLKLDVPTYKKKDLPSELKKIPITKPGSRFLR